MSHAPDSAREALDSAYQAVAGLLKNGQRFLVTGHRNPDGDSLGSALALALALEDAGKEAVIVVRDSFSSAYAGLPGIERVLVSDTLPQDWASRFDALLTMECPDESRPGFPDIRSGTLVNIDHHPGNTLYGTLNLVDLPAAAVGEIIASLLDLLDWPLTPAIATNLWVSLVSDTGSFRYGNTTARALALAARLVAAGVEPGTVNEFLL
jgi:phosphoesterase RecJ-like protein